MGVWIGIVILVIILLIVVTNIRIVPQAHAYILERLGGYRDTWSVGVPYLSIRQFLEKLPKQGFFQCHRMFVVNQAYVQYFDLVNQMLQVEGYPEEIDIGVTYKTEIKRIMKD